MLRRLAASLLALVITVPVVVLTSAGTVAARDGLAVTSTTTYTLDATSGVVHVLAEMTFTNTLPDQRDGNVIRRRYFAGFSLPAPAGALNPVATTSNGRGLRITGRFVEGNTNFYLLDIDFASNLFYGQTARVSVTYDITGLPPRSDNPSRVNAAYAAFDAFGIGDAGKVTVRVVVPEGFTIDTFGDEATVTTENGTTVYSATDIPHPDEFDIFVSARNDGALTDDEVTTGQGEQFHVRAWPGDSEWQQFVTDQIDEGVPALSELVGQPWPIDDPVEVREAYTPYLYGYAGWFSPTDKEIEVGENLDQEVVLHELSHAWFNNDTVIDRWLSEGLAQVYSNKAVASLGGTAATPDEPRTSDPGHLALNSWGDPKLTTGADEVEPYGYNASFWVVQQIADEVGDERMRTVIDAMVHHEIAYQGDAEPEAITGVSDRTGWRRFLDLVEELGGATGAADLLERYVVSDDQSDSLQARADARDAYHQLVDDGGEWAPPLVVRRAMASWLFPTATKAIDGSEQVLALRDQLDAKAEELDTTYPADLEAHYEAADRNLDAVAAEVQAQLDAADTLLAGVAAEAKDDGFFGGIGLIGTDLPGTLDEAKAAFATGDLATAEAKAQRVIATVGDASDVGTKRVLVAAAALVLLLLLTGGSVLWRRRRRAKAAATESVDEQATDPSGGVDPSDLDEDALAGAGLGGIDDGPEVPLVDDGEAP